MANQTKADLQKENDFLKKELSSLKDMMKQIMDMNSSTNNNKKDTSEIEKNNSGDNIDDYGENNENVHIPPTELINVTSLFNGGMTLIGSHGQPIRFVRFGQTMPITFQDLNHVCSNNRTLAEDGYFYINNKNAIKLLYLFENYEKIITVKEIENFIKLTTSEMEKLYNRVAKNIQDSIIDLVVKGIIKNDPEYRDRNKIEFIGSLRGKDLEKMAKNLQEYDIK